MKSLAISVLLFAAVCHAQDSDCQTMKVKKLEMEIIALNIENVNTTNAEGGGPYKRKKIVCKPSMCAEISYAETITKHIPGHPDADKDGNVKFPDINLENEMQSMIEARTAYEIAQRNCKG